MKTITMEINDSRYNINIGKGIVGEIKRFIKEIDIDDKLFIITDKNVEKLYLEEILNYLTKFKVNTFVIDPGEDSKSLDTAKSIYSTMIDFNYDRNSTIIALGGGVVGDVAGFVASTYMRGVNFIQIPTTLLSQVDSSIGGKTGVNFSGYKNMIGTFYHPNLVIIDTEFLRTLDKREFISGLGEVYKYGLIDSYNFFNWLTENLHEIINLKDEYIDEVIRVSLETKKSIVESDEKENSIRRILNFGHTLGHGIETLDRFSMYKHGEAVILGMIYESFIAMEMNLIEKGYYINIRKSLEKLIAIPKLTDKEINKVQNAILHDKKKTGGNLVFILPNRRGGVGIYTNINENIITRALKEGHTL